MENTKTNTDSTLRLEETLSTPAAIRKIEQFAAQHRLNYHFATTLIRALYEHSIDTTLDRLPRIQEEFSQGQKTGTITELGKHYYAIPNAHKTYFVNQEFRDLIELETGLAAQSITAKQVQDFTKQWNNISKVSQDKKERIVIIDPAYDIGYKFVRQKPN